MVDSSSATERRPDAAGATSVDDTDGPPCGEASSELSGSLTGERSGAWRRAPLLFDKKKPPSGACPNKQAAPRCDQREPTAWAAETDGTRISRAASAALPFCGGTVPAGDCPIKRLLGQTLRGQSLPLPYARPMARYVGRENVRKRLAPLGGQPGRTIYAAGEVRIEMQDETITVRPPFGLSHEAEYETVQLEPLFEALGTDHVIAALLVRLGGYAVGVFDGERLVASKVGSRFVKGRHKKGGSSSGRFSRRREEQARALTEAAADTAVRVLNPWRDRAEYVALGGDRTTVEHVIAAHSELAWLADRALPRFFDVPEPRLRVLERLPYDLYAAELTVSARVP